MHKGANISHWMHATHSQIRMCQQPEAHVLLTDNYESCRPVQCLTCNELGSRTQNSAEMERQGVRCGRDWLLH
jgi:hypothetical protein